MTAMEAIAYTDLRATAPEDFEAALAAARTALPPGGGLALTAWQAKRAAARGPIGVPVAVTAPDFLNYARLLGTGQAGAVIALAGGLVPAGIAGITASPAVLASPLRAAKQDFWVVAEVLLRFDMALLPASLPRDTPILLHPYLADFAFLFERRDFIATFFRLAAARGAAGIHTLQRPLALSCLARWDCPARWISTLGDGPTAGIVRIAIEP